MSRLLKYIEEDGEGVADPGATTTDDIAKFEKKIPFKERRRDRKRIHVPDEEEEWPDFFIER